MHGTDASYASSRASTIAPDPPPHHHHHQPLNATDGVVSAAAAASPAPLDAASGHGQCSSASSIHQRLLGVCSCDCMFIDVGLNDGRSLQAWPQEVLSRLGRRGPFHQVSKCLQLKSSSATINNPKQVTCWYGFEANPGFSSTLSALQQRLRGNGLRVHLFTNTAFNVNTEPVDFFVDSQAHGLGSTLVSTNVVHSHVRGPLGGRGSKWVFDSAHTVHENFTRIRSQSVDAGSFLRSALKTETSSSLIALKIDVEGFEYRLLRHLLYNGFAEYLCRIDLLAVEWHTHTGTNGTQTARVSSKNVLGELQEACRNTAHGRSPHAISWH